MPHTPGPWEVERRYSNGCEIIPRIHCEKSKDRECGWIADVIGAPYLGYESTLHNARLIAAAPELLEALNRLLPMAEDDVSQYGGDPDKDDDVIFARSAIAKATGK